MKTIIVNSKKYGTKEVVLDDCFYNEAIKHSWYIKTYGGNGSVFYAYREIWLNKKKKAILMHRQIMNFPEKGILIDHKNRNGLDNRKENLRLCNSSQNSQNCAPYGKYKYKGVDLKKKTVKGKDYLYWRSRIKIGEKETFLGYFPYTPEGEIQAAKVYDEMARIHFKEFARLNFK